MLTKAGKMGALRVEGVWFLNRCPPEEKSYRREVRGYYLYPWLTNIPVPMDANVKMYTCDCTNQCTKACHPPACLLVHPCPHWMAAECKHYPQRPAWMGDPRDTWKIAGCGALIVQSHVRMFTFASVSACTLVSHAYPKYQQGPHRWCM